MIKMRISRLLLIACCIASPALGQRVPFPPGPGKDAVEAGCATCHSLAYIPMNSRFLTQEQWQAEVTKMRMAFGAPIDDDAAKAIVDYLVANFGGQSK
jgi:hypothetical protein